MPTTRRFLRAPTAVFAAGLAAAGASPAAAQQSVSEVLSFLLTNRSIVTDDFVRDEQATAATRDAISNFLLIELATLPVASSAGGFTYRLNPSLGTVTRSSDSFGPFFTERSLTAGRRQSSFALSFQSSSFQTIDGRELRDGTLVSTASRIRGESTPFDVETVTLRLRANTMTLAGNVGISDRLDVGAALPVVRLTLSGQRLDTYRGREFPQATGTAAVSGLGDVLVRAKYNLFRADGGGVAVGGEARLPTGDSDNLLGSGELALRPRIIASMERTRLGIHGDLGYSVGGLTRELTFAGAVTGVAAPNLTLIGELAGRRLEGFNRLVDVTEPHPRLSGVDTIRLTAEAQSTVRVIVVGGVKWNFASTWLISANVMRPLTSAGLNASWVPTVTIDYSFGR